MTSAEWKRGFQAGSTGMKQTLKGPRRFIFGALILVAILVPPLLHNLVGVAYFVSRSAAFFLACMCTYFFLLPKELRSTQRLVFCTSFALVISFAVLLIERYWWRS